MRAAPDVLERFRAEVGPDGPVTVAGGMTQWDVGGPVDGSARVVRAPTGVVSHLPAEMIVRVRAGTTVAELDDALGSAGQFVPLDPPDPRRATVGGVLSVGRSGPRRLRWGPVRDCVLEVRFVSAAGELLKGGAPVVKNVSGFDMGRLLTGSLGTLGFLAEVVLRTHPRPAARRWLAGGGDPQQTFDSLYRPSTVLWDGARTWVLLEGHPADVADQAGRLPGFAEVAGPPPLPAAGRVSLAPSAALGWAAGLGPGSFVVEVGVGVVHLGPEAAPAPAPPGPDPAAAAIAARLKARFDPGGRLNPGRRP
ncbi:MAG TPA: FAD-binding protein [Acidimicrobiales bacterium]|nr:FAD-binding protein [Acidimicrobiales bacterium]